MDVSVVTWLYETIPAQLDRAGHLWKRRGTGIVLHQAPCNGDSVKLSCQVVPRSRFDI